MQGTVILIALFRSIVLLSEFNRTECRSFDHQGLFGVSHETFRPRIFGFEKAMVNPTACNGYIVRECVSHSNTRDIAKIHVRCARETNVTLAIYKCRECLYVHFPRSGPLENAMPQGRAYCGPPSPCPVYFLERGK